MTIYIAVTGDEYELPLFVADSAKEMAEWAGIKVDSVYSGASKNKNKPPFKANTQTCEYRIRRIIMEDDENDKT